MKTIAIILIVSVLTGCATSASNLKPTGVNATKYNGVDCETLATEIERVELTVKERKQEVDRKATKDKILTTAGLLLFWPAFFFLSGDGVDQNEYQRAQGELESLKIAQQRNCLVADLNR